MKSVRRLLVAVTILLGTLVATTVATPSNAFAASSAQLSYSFQWQQNYYYCGPAATRIALTARGYYYSQDYLAGQLGTTKYGTNSAADTTRVLNSLGYTG